VDAVSQQHPSRLGSRWGLPRAIQDATTGGSTPDLRADEAAADLDGHHCIKQQPPPQHLDTKVGHRNDIVVSGDAEPSRPMENKKVYVPVEVSTINNTEETSSTFAELSVPSPKVSPVVCCGFTAKESRAVETTELTEASTVTSAASKCASSTTPSSTVTAPPPTAVVVLRQQEVEPEISKKITSTSLLSDTASPTAMFLDFRIPKKKVSIGPAPANAAVPRTSNDFNGLIPNTKQESGAAPFKKRKHVPEAIAEKPTETSSNEPRIPLLQKSMKKRRLQKFSEELTTDEQPLAEDDNATTNCNSDKKKRKKKSEKNPDCQDPSLVTVGARVAVFWDGEREYFTGTVTKEVPGKKKPFLVKYDDGDKEWMTFHGERFKLLSVPGGRKAEQQKQSTVANYDATEAVDRQKRSLEEESAMQYGNQKCPTSVELAAFRGKDSSMKDVGSSPTKNTACGPKKDYSCDTRREASSGSNIVGEMKAKGSSAVDENTGELKCFKSSLQAKAKKVSSSPAKTEAGIQPKRADNSVERKFKESGATTKSKKTSCKEPATQGAGKPVATTGSHEQGSSALVQSVATTEGNVEEQDWVSAGISKEDSSSDSETDEEELMDWASTMFGISQPIARHMATAIDEQEQDSKPAWTMLDPSWDDGWCAAGVPMSISEKVKLARRSRSCVASYALTSPTRRQNKSKGILEARAMAEAEKEEDSKRKKEQARPLTAAEISSILGEDRPSMASSSWVRRSVRQPSKSSLNAPRVKALLEKLRSNDSDMVVLKMKKYCSDLETPTLVIDAVLDALEENTNCEALYIQVRSVSQCR
jgi:hypothetical protein